MIEVAVIDYGAGNIGSLINSLRYLNVKPVVISEPSKTNYSHIILPGVGSFGKLSKNLRKSNLNEYIYENLKKGNNLLGICVGMQLIFQESEESSGEKGLGIIEGKLEKIFHTETKMPLPHVGFSKVINSNSKLFKNIHENPYFYFIHSYCLKKAPEKSNYCITEYVNKFISFFEKDNIFGSQFHPEKSHKTGLKLIQNFLNL